MKRGSKFSENYLFFLCSLAGSFQQIPWKQEEISKEKYIYNLCGFIEL